MAARRAHVEDRCRAADERLAKADAAIADAIQARDDALLKAKQAQHHAEQAHDDAAAVSHEALVSKRPVDAAPAGMGPVTVATAGAASHPSAVKPSTPTLSA